MIICNLHGGMGNQLFQAYYSLLITSYKNEKVIFLTGSLSKYKTSRKIEIEDLINHSFLNLEIKSDFMFMSRLRFPKIFSKLNIIKYGIIKIFNLTIIDDYCSNYLLYQKFDYLKLNSNLEIFRSYFYNIQSFDKISLISSTIFHLRLTDYFKSTSSEIQEIDDFINTNYNNTIMNIVTDNENLLLNYVNSYKYNLITTKDLSSQNLFFLFASFNNIYTNKSTLSLWASIIYKRDIFTTNAEFLKFHSLINE
jgi:hypothetical protein